MILNMLMGVLKNHKRCKHIKVTPFSAGDFCPDCGMEIKISWVFLRCACCNTKREACVVFNSLRSKNKYCIKCGAWECIVEKKEHVEFFEVKYAVISKMEVNKNHTTQEILQIWIDNERKSSDILDNLKLIPLLVQ